MSSSKISPFQPKLNVNEFFFSLATAVSSNPFNFVNAHCSWAGFKCKECALIKLIGLLLTTMASLLFSLHLSWNRKKFGPRHCLTKCALENKLLSQNCWSWYHFSQEKLPRTLIPIIASTYCGKYPVPFFSGPPCIVKQFNLNSTWPIYFSNVTFTLLKGNIHSSWKDDIKIIFGKCYCF